MSRARTLLLQPTLSLFHSLDGVTAERERASTEKRSLFYSAEYTNDEEKEDTTPGAAEEKEREGPNSVSC